MYMNIKLSKISLTYLVIFLARQTFSIASLHLPSLSFPAPRNCCLMNYALSLTLGQVRSRNEIPGTLMESKTCCWIVLYAADYCCYLMSVMLAGFIRSSSPCHNDIALSLFLGYQVVGALYQEFAWVSTALQKGDGSWSVLYLDTMFLDIMFQVEPPQWSQSTLKSDWVKKTRVVRTRSKSDQESNENVVGKFNEKKMNSPRRGRWS